MEDDDFEFDPSDYEPFTMRLIGGRPEPGGAYWMHESGKTMECLFCGQMTNRPDDIEHRFCDACRRDLGPENFISIPRWHDSHALCKPPLLEGPSEKRYQRALGRLTIAMRSVRAALSQHERASALRWCRRWLTVCQRSGLELQ